MIFLRNNVLMERGLTFQDIKPRLLGTHFPVRSVTEYTDVVQVIGERVQA